MLYLIFIQTAQQEAEGLVIGGVLVLLCLALGLWANFSDNKTTNLDSSRRKSTNSEYLKKNINNVDAVSKNNMVFSKDREALLKSLIETPWLIWEGLLIEVKHKNPDLVKLALEKIKLHKEKVRQKNIENGFVNDFNTSSVDISKNQEIKSQKNIDILSDVDTSGGGTYTAIIKNIDFELDSSELSDYKRKLRDELLNQGKIVNRIDVQYQFKLKKKRSRCISQDVKDKVWRRDEGRCVECGSNENLEFDHIIPHSRGGANTYRNIQLLCESCNRSKSDKIG